MALQLKDRVSSGCTATGTNDIVFGDDTPSFHNWSVVDNGSTVYYCIVDKDEFEVGQGVKSTNGITRDTIFTSTNGGAKINLSGNADVFLTYPADKAVAKDEDGNVTIGGDLTVDGIINSESLTLEELGIMNHNRITVDDDGNVGIGENDPRTFGQNWRALTVRGDDYGLIKANNNASVTTELLSSNDAGRVGTRYEHPFAIKTNEVDRMVFDTNGKVTVNGSLETETVGLSNDWTLVGQPSSLNISQSGANKVTVSNAGALTATTLSGSLNGSNLVDASVTNAKIANTTITGGKIANNTITPTQLNVSGNGGNNQMLCSSGNGAMKWVNQPSGGASTTYHGVATYSVSTNINKLNLNTTSTFSGYPGTWRIMGYCEYSSGAMGSSDHARHLIIRIS